MKKIIKYSKKKMDKICLNTKTIILVVGTRPNFIKAFPVYNILKKDYRLILIHTGQHFDNNMSQVFFNQFKFPKPDIHLKLNNRTKAGKLDEIIYNNKNFLENKNKILNQILKNKNYEDCGQLGEIINHLNSIFKKEKPDLIILFGDVTSTLAGAISAKTNNIKIAHVESGLRSFDLSMPEEINRILTDYLTNFFFVTEESAILNLEKEGLNKNIFLVGNTMIDTQKICLNNSLNTHYYDKIGLVSKNYILITLHRPNNVDNSNKINKIIEQILILSRLNKIVYPIHHRTKKKLIELNLFNLLNNNKNIVLCNPLGYLEFMCLLYNSKFVITDSGGIQEETTSLNVPCFTFRENTERPITLIKNSGTNTLIKNINNISKLDSYFKKIYEIDHITGKFKYFKTHDIYGWDGTASKNIFNIIQKLNKQNIF